MKAINYTLKLLLACAIGFQPTVYSANKIAGEPIDTEFEEITVRDTESRTHSEVAHAANIVMGTDNGKGFLKLADTVAKLLKVKSDDRNYTPEKVDPSNARISAENIESMLLSSVPSARYVGEFLNVMNIAEAGRESFYSQEALKRYNSIDLNFTKKPSISSAIERGAKFRRTYLDYLKLDFKGDTLDWIINPNSKLQNGIAQDLQYYNQNISLKKSENQARLEAGAETASRFGSTPLTRYGADGGAALKYWNRRYDAHLDDEYSQKKRALPTAEILYNKYRSEIDKIILLNLEKHLEWVQDLHNPKVNSDPIFLRSHKSLHKHREFYTNYYPPERIEDPLFSYSDEHPSPKLSTDFMNSFDDRSLKYRNGNYQESSKLHNYLNKNKDNEKTKINFIHPFLQSYGTLSDIVEKVIYETPRLAVSYKKRSPRTNDSSDYMYLSGINLQSFLLNSQINPLDSIKNPHLAKYRYFNEFWQRHIQLVAAKASLTKVYEDSFSKIRKKETTVKFLLALSSELSSSFVRFERSSETNSPTRQSLTANLAINSQRIGRSNDTPFWDLQWSGLEHSNYYWLHRDDIANRLHLPYWADQQLTNTNPKSFRESRNKLIQNVEHFARKRSDLTEFSHYHSAASMGRLQREISIVAQKVVKAHWKTTGFLLNTAVSPLRLETPSMERLKYEIKNDKISFAVLLVSLVGMLGFTGYVISTKYSTESAPLSNQSLLSNLSLENSTHPSVEQLIAQFSKPIDHYIPVNKIARDSYQNSYGANKKNWNGLINDTSSPTISEKNNSLESVNSRTIETMRSIEELALYQVFTSGQNRKAIPNTFLVPGGRDILDIRKNITSSAISLNTEQNGASLSDISLLSNAYTYVTNNKVPLPVPLYHTISSLKVKNKEGMLTEGRDYQLYRYDLRPLYYLKMKDSSKKVRFQIGYKKEIRTGSENFFATLNPYILNDISHTLKINGFTSTSSNINKLIQSGRTTLFDIEKAFKSSAFYTYRDPIHNDSPPINNKSRYSRFQYFLDKGTLYYQCTGGMFFTEVMREYYQRAKNHSMEVYDLSGFYHNQGQRGIYKENAHNISMIRDINGENEYLFLDTTPSRTDSRGENNNPRSRVAVQSLDQENEFSGENPIKQRYKEKADQLYKTKTTTWLTQPEIEYAIPFYRAEENSWHMPNTPEFLNINSKFNYINIKRPISKLEISTVLNQMFDEHDIKKINILQIERYLYKLIAANFKFDRKLSPPQIPKNNVAQQDAILSRKLKVAISATKPIEEKGTYKKEGRERNGSWTEYFNRTLGLLKNYLHKFKLDNSDPLPETQEIIVNIDKNKTMTNETKLKLANDISERASSLTKTIRSLNVTIYDLKRAKNNLVTRNILNLTVHLIEHLKGHTDIDQLSKALSLSSARPDLNQNFRARIEEYSSYIQTLTNKGHQKIDRGQPLDLNTRILTDFRIKAPLDSLLLYLKNTTFFDSSTAGVNNSCHEAVKL